MSFDTNKNRDFFICCNENNVDEARALLKQFPYKIDAAFDNNKCLKWAAWDIRKSVIEFLLLQPSVVRQNVHLILNFLFSYRLHCEAILILVACGFRCCISEIETPYQIQRNRLCNIEKRRVLEQIMQTSNIASNASTLRIGLAQLNLPILTLVFILSTCAEPFGNLLPWHVLWNANV